MRGALGVLLDIRIPDSPALGEPMRAFVRSTLFLVVLGLSFVCSPPFHFLRVLCPVWCFVCP